MCFVKKKNVLTCFLLVCIISLFLPLNTIAQPPLPKYEIVEEKLDKLNKAPSVKIFVYVDKSATEKEVKQIAREVYRQKILTDPRYKNSKYCFRIGITFDLDIEYVVANLIERWMFERSGPKYKFNKSIFDAIKNDESCYRVRRGYLVNELVLDENDKLLPYDSPDF